MIVTDGICVTDRLPVALAEVDVEIDLPFLPTMAKFVVNPAVGEGEPN